MLSNVNKLKSILIHCLAVVVLSLVTLVPILSKPQTVSAATAPTYRYTKVLDGTSGFAATEDTATDKSGDVYVTGYFGQGTVDFDGIGGSSSYTSSNNDAFLTKYNPNGSYAWTKVFDTTGGLASAFSIAVDSSGNVYTTGVFSGTVVFDGVGGSDSVTSNNSDAFITKYNANGTYGWTKTLDTSNGSARAQPTSIAVDSSGNIYAAGSFTGSVTFDGPGGTDTQTSPTYDAYLTKYNANGTYGWTKIDGAGASDRAYNEGLAIDGNGDIYVTGNFQGTVTLNGGSALTSSNGTTFLAKYNPNGSYAWTKVFDPSSGSYTEYGGITTDSAGNVYLAGSFAGTVVFDGVGGSDSRTSAQMNAYLTKYNANGTYGWTKTIYAPSGSYEQNFGVATDLLGDIYVESGWNGTVTFDGPGGSDTRTTTSPNSGLTMYNPNGSYAWTKTFDTSNGNAVAQSNEFASITTDDLGNVYVAGGNFFGTVVFDGPGGTDSLTATGSDSFLTSYSVFTPSSSTAISITTTATSSTPGIPDTGYGVPNRANPTIFLWFMSVGLMLIAGGLHFVYKQKL